MNDISTASLFATSAQKTVTVINFSVYIKRIFLWHKSSQKFQSHKSQKSQKSHK